MADAVESVCAALDPPLRLVETLVMAAARLHADDTTVPVLASGKTDTGDAGFTYGTLFWGARPPAAMSYFLRRQRPALFRLGRARGWLADQRRSRPINPKIAARTAKICALRAMSTARSPARSAVVEGFPRSMLGLIESILARPEWTCRIVSVACFTGTRLRCIIQFV